MDKKTIDITKMSAEEVIRLVANDPEIVKRLVIAKEEQDKRAALKIKREEEEKLAKYRQLINPVVGAVITNIEEISDGFYEYAGETHIFTTKGKIIINGTVDEVVPNE